MHNAKNNKIIITEGNSKQAGRKAAVDHPGLLDAYEYLYKM